MADGASGNNNWEKPTLFVFSSVCFAVLLTIAWFGKSQPPQSWYIFLIVLAVSAGGIAAMIPGTISVELPGGIKAAGALAIAALVYYGGSRIPVDQPRVQDLSSNLFFNPEYPCRDVETGSLILKQGADEQDYKTAQTKVNVLPPCAPNTRLSDIYVLVNWKRSGTWKIVARDLHTGPPIPGWDVQTEKGHEVVVTRGMSGPVVKFTELQQGDRIVVIQTEKGQWWQSSEMTIPDAQLAMTPSSFSAIETWKHYAQ